MRFPFEAEPGLGDDDIWITYFAPNVLETRAKLQTASAGLEMDVVREA